MTITVEALWITLGLMIVGTILIAVLATAQLEAELLKLPAYKENNFLKLKFFIMFVWWIVPAVIGLVGCLIQMSLSL